MLSEGWYARFLSLMNVPGTEMSGRYNSICLSFSLFFFLFYFLLLLVIELRASHTIQKGSTVNLIGGTVQFECRGQDYWKRSRMLRNDDFLVDSHWLAVQCLAGFFHVVSPHYSIHQIIVNFQLVSHVICAFNSTHTFRALEIAHWGVLCTEKLQSKSRSLFWRAVSTVKSSSHNSQHWHYKKTGD